MTTRRYLTAVAVVLGVSGVLGPAAARAEPAKIDPAARQAFVKLLTSVKPTPKARPTGTLKAFAPRGYGSPIRP